MLLLIQHHNRKYHHMLIASMQKIFIFKHGLKLLTESESDLACPKLSGLTTNNKSTITTTLGLGQTKSD